LVRAMWHGTLSFGLVPIPIGVCAVRSNGGSPLHEYHSCGGEVGYKKFCKQCGAELTWKDPSIRKGEKVQGRVITYTQEEIKAIQPESSRDLKILGVIDRVPELEVMTEGVYLIAPVPKRGEQVPDAVKVVFKLIANLLRKHDKVAVTKMTSRGKEHLAILEPTDSGNGLLLRTMSFHSQVRWEEIREAEAEIAAVEIPDEYRELGEQLLTAMQKDPSILREVRSEFGDRLAQLRESKLKGQPVPPKTEERSPDTTDLLEALRKSVGMSS